MEEKTINWIGDIDHISGFLYELNAEYPELKVVQTEQPMDNLETDLYIVDFSIYPCFADILDNGLAPCIVFGNSPNVFTSSVMSGFCDAVALPMNKHELIFRIFRNISSSSIHFGIDKVSFSQRLVSGMCKTEPISHIQFKLMRMFSNSPGSLYSRESIAQYIGIKVDPNSRIVDVYISQLRKKLKFVMGISEEMDFDPIMCVRGKGYRIEKKPVDNL